MAHPQDRQFSFEKLLVWQFALEALTATNLIAQAIPRPYCEVSEQVRRASISIICNLSEGVGKDGRDQLRFFRIARGSTYESAALVEGALRLRVISAEQRNCARQPLLSVAALLSRLLLQRVSP